MEATTFEETSEILLDRISVEVLTGNAEPTSLQINDDIRTLQFLDKVLGISRQHFPCWETLSYDYFRRLSQSNLLNLS